jgi:hypothetical protein
MHWLGKIGVGRHGGVGRRDRRLLWLLLRLRVEVEGRAGIGGRGGADRIVRHRRGELRRSRSLLRRRSLMRGVTRLLVVLGCLGRLWWGPASRVLRHLLRGILVASRSSHGAPLVVGPVLRLLCWLRIGRMRRRMVVVLLLLARVEALCWPSRTGRTGLQGRIRP